MLLLEGPWGPWGLPSQVERGVVAAGTARITSHWACSARKGLRRHVTDVPLREIKNMPKSLHPGCGPST